MQQEKDKYSKNKHAMYSSSSSSPSSSCLRVVVARVEQCLELLPEFLVGPFQVLHFSLAPGRAARQLLLRRCRLLRRRARLVRFLELLLERHERCGGVSGLRRSVAYPHTRRMACNIAPLYYKAAPG